MFLRRRIFISLCRARWNKADQHQRSVHVSVLGASTPLGQSMSLLLTTAPNIEQLNIHDYSNKAKGVATDLEHIPGNAYIQAWVNNLECALKLTDIVVLAQGQPRKSYQTDIDLFYENAEELIVAAQAIAKYCPKSFVVVCTEPINKTVPLVGRALEHCKIDYKKRLFGVTGVDVMRAQKYYSLTYDLPFDIIDVPVIGGHSPKTIVPLFSNAKPKFDLNSETASKLTELVRGVEQKIKNLKCGWGDSPLSSALAGYCTVNALLKSIKGKDQEHYAFVPNNRHKTKYFAGLIETDKEGIKILKPHDKISYTETKYLSESLKHLKQDVLEGEKYCTEILKGEKVIIQQQSKIIDSENSGIKLY